MPTENRSSNTEMVSVPRELTPEMREAFHSSYEAYEDGRGECPDSQWLAMLRAAPKPAEQRQGEPVAWIFRQLPEAQLEVTERWDVAKHLPYDTTPVYTHADPSEIERLQRRIQNAELALKVQTQNCDALRAQLAERDALSAEPSAQSCEHPVKCARFNNGEIVDHICQDCLQVFKSGAPVERDERAEFDRIEGQKFLNWYRGRYGVTPMAAGDRSIGEYAAWLARAALERKP